MDFSELRFHNRSKETLKQIYAVVHYMKQGLHRSEAVIQTAKDLQFRYNTVDDKIARHFAGSVYIFEDWYRSGALLERLISKFRLNKHDTEIFEKLLEEDITIDPLFPMVEEDLLGMNAEEEEPGSNAYNGKEGKQSLRIVRFFERKAKLRTQSIKIHGLKCKVCGFDFEEIYGQIGKNYIEVHHHKPISTFDREMEVDPRNDMTVLCCNCHRMIHRSTQKVLTVEELQIIYNQNAIN